MAADEIDIPASPKRSLALLLACAAFLVLTLVVMAVIGLPDAPIKAAVVWLGVPFWVFGIVRALQELRRRGPVVSVGPRGIFDRRISADWIAWPAIRSVTSVTMDRQTFLMMGIDPAEEPALPITAWARRLAAMNAGIGFEGYAIVSATLVGGYPALVEAVRREMARQGRSDLP